MKQKHSLLMNRNSQGFISMKILISVLVIFAVYCGYKYMMISLAAGEMERAVESMINNTGWTTSYESLETKIKSGIIKNADADSIVINEDDIIVSRERSEGEYLVEVVFPYPVKTSFLGVERTLDKRFHVEGSILINEAEFARREELLEKSDRIVSNINDALSECEQIHGKGNCRLEMGPDGATEEEIIKNY
jgi:hypothetical protein